MIFSVGNFLLSVRKLQLLALLAQYLKNFFFAL